MVRRLEAAAAEGEAVSTTPESLPEDWERFDELADEWEEDDATSDKKACLTPDQIADLKREIAELREFHGLAKSIIKNSKGEVLLTALRRGFAAAEAQAAQGSPALQQKAVIFTESRRTQEYLFRLLEQTEFRGRVMLFNGTNNDPTSKAIYQSWLAKHAGTDRISGSPSADMRAALVEYFRDEAAILIATEAAAEGINLQFCNLVVNYDLPWNPQRIEQRIGRCHRYGQKFDVVVVNFLNKTNAADQRVYELLDQKFRLFDGVFGASDEVLGAIESGVDFEKRIAAIYHKCRTRSRSSSSSTGSSASWNHRLPRGSETRAKSSSTISIRKWSRRYASRARMCSIVSTSASGDSLATCCATTRALKMRTSASCSIAIPSLAKPSIPVRTASGSAPKTPIPTASGTRLRSECSLSAVAWIRHLQRSRSATGTTVRRSRSSSPSSAPAAGLPARGSR
jgi:superfamily II DNA/RNA helicase